MRIAAFIAEQRTEHGVPHATVCRLIGVSQSWFYKWLNRPPTPRQTRRDQIDAAVRASFEASEGDYGSPRVLEDLKEAGFRVSKKTVEASMARQGLVARPPRRPRRGLTRPDKAAEPIADLLQREFGATEVDHKWCGDLTESPTEEGKLYLAAVEDLCSRRVPGFAIGEHHDAPLAVEAINMAVAVRGGDVTGVVFHSDKGSEGGFNWPSQHLDHGGGAWDDSQDGRPRPRVAQRDARRTDRRQCAYIGDRFPHREHRPWHGAKTGSDSGQQSLVA